jgi:transcription elongation factor Elf1
VSILTYHLHTFVFCSRLNLTPDDYDYNQSTNSAYSFSYSCLTCRCAFLLKNELISHFESLHPSQVNKCYHCEEVICGPKHVLANHVNTHKVGGTEDVDALLNKCISRLGPSIDKFDPEFVVISLGDMNPKLRVDAHDIIDVYCNEEEHRFIKPDMLPKITVALDDFIKCFELPDHWKAVKCYICQKFVPAPRYEEHKRTVHFIELCCHCNAKVSKSKMLQHIQAKHSGGKDIICKYCDDDFRATGNSQPHMWTMESLRHKCPHNDCNEAFDTVRSLERHYKLCHNNGPATCDFCQKVFGNKDRLQRHIRHFHVPVAPGYFPCTECGRHFISQTLLREHMSHHGKVPCQICGKQYKPCYLSIHMNCHTNKFSCKYCNKTFVSNDLLMNHENRHTGISFTCPICKPKMTFRVEKSFKNHMKRHEQAGNLELPEHLRPVKCDICGKMIANQHYLRVHKLKNHEGNKKHRGNKRRGNPHIHGSSYPCYSCLLRFLTKECYDAHVQTYHPDGEPSALPNVLCKEFRYQCSYCTKTFKKKDFCHQHEAVHRGERNYLCQFCGKTFLYFSDKSQHVTKFHLDERQKNRK